MFSLIILIALIAALIGFLLGFQLHYQRGVLDGYEQACADLERDEHPDDVAAINWTLAAPMSPPTSTSPPAP